MDQREALNILHGAKAIITETHVVLTSSGRHTGWYLNKDALYTHTEMTSELCRAIAEQFADNKPEVVIAPALGGIILSQWTAYHLTKMLGYEVLAVYAEKDEGLFVIRRGYDALIADKRILVVEDTLTTGASAKKVIGATRAQKGNVIGLGVICNRGKITARHVGGVPRLVSLTTINIDTWMEEECPLCEQNVPINTEIGHGDEFLAQQRT